MFAFAPFRLTSGNAVNKNELFMFRGSVTIP
jgi:hypothetical protein